MRRATRSRTHRQCVWGLALLLSLLCASPGQAQYTQSHGVFSAGGGFSQSDVYQNIGTLGQASPLGRSSHQLAVNYGGFWGGGVSGAAYTLTVQKGGDGQGTVTGGGITCDPDCLSQSIVCEEHTTVMLNAQEAPGSTFEAWQIDGQPVTGEVTVTHDLTIAAIFTSINAPPEITSTAPSLEGPVYYYTVQATDPDNDVLTFSLLTAPEGMTINVATGSILWEPLSEQLGTHNVEVKVDDGRGGTATAPFSLEVTAVIFDEEAPVVTLSVTPTQILLGDSVTMTLVATDNIGVVSAQARVNTDVVLTAQGSSAYTPTAPGTYTVYGFAKDGAWNEGMAQETFWVRGTSATINFHEGFDAERGATERDPAIFTMVPLHIQMAEEIALPGTDIRPFAFGANVDFHVQYHQRAIVLVPEETVPAVLLANTAYATVTSADIANLTLWTEGQTVGAADTVIVLTADGQYFKVGNFHTVEADWTVTFEYEELQP